MRTLDKAGLRLRSLFRRREVDFELEAALRFHLAGFDAARRPTRQKAASHSAAAEIPLVLRYV
ncbi:MAG: hypothetical protein EHM23_09935 [Acidobacteria bacterium]|nr:MAG: hypothetical protein EHM23_09935 [Acidobacteriota bacterium]